MTGAFVCGVAAHAQPTRQSANELWRTERWEEASVEYRQLADAHPGEGTYWYRLAYSLQASGRLDEAIEAYGRAAEFELLRPGVLYNVACAHAQSGRIDEALDALDESARLGGFASNLLEIDADLDPLRDHPRYQQIRTFTRRPPEFNQMRRLGFWFGEWDVLTDDGTRVGSSTIEARQNEWIVHESWADTTGDTGEAIYYFDVRAQTWRVVWIDQSGSVAQLEGAIDRQGVARFEGIEQTSRGVARMVRFSLEAAEEGTVRRVIEESFDAGETWRPQLIATYVRTPGE